MPTKRPQNGCERCPHTWYPRGQDRSKKCPKCGSSRTYILQQSAKQQTAYEDKARRGRALKERLYREKLEKAHAEKARLKREYEERLYHERRKQQYEERLYQEKLKQERLRQKKRELERVHVEKARLKREYEERLYAERRKQEYEERLYQERLEEERSREERAKEQREIEGLVELIKRMGENDESYRAENAQGGEVEGILRQLIEHGDMLCETACEEDFTEARYAREYEETLQQEDNVGRGVDVAPTEITFTQTSKGEEKSVACVVS